MTNIVINIGPDTMKLSMSGHACYRMDGNDVVCSAVSVLGQALADAMFHAPDIRSTAKWKKEIFSWKLITEKNSGNTLRIAWQ